MSLTLSTASRRGIVFVGLALLLLAPLLAGCGSSSLKVGWRETSSLKQKQAQYVTFDGTQTKTFHAEAGQTITLEYKVTVEKGSLTLKLVAPGGESLWEETYHENGEDAVSVTMPDDGRYTLRIEGEETGGSFDISWSMQE